MKNKHGFFYHIREIIDVFPGIIVIGLFVIITIYLHFKKPDLPKNENWCAAITMNKIKSDSSYNYYGQITLNGTDILSFQSPNGKVVYSNEFLSNDLKSNLNADIVTKEGMHYKIILLSTGACKIKTEMDSLLKHNDDEHIPEPNY